MIPQRTAGQRRSTLRPKVDPQRCIGCGVCAGSCRREAIHMVEDNRPYVPYDVIERIVRMSLERGRLADLLFDMGTSRTHRFMNRVVQALMELPSAERIMAHQQVRSRFVKYATKLVPDPTG